MINILIWMFFGGLAGWIISLLVSTKSEDTTRYILMGITGALFGGLCAQLVQGMPLTTFNGSTVIISVMSALILLGVIKRIVQP